jgi:hypothetical protein
LNSLLFSINILHFVPTFAHHHSKHFNLHLFISSQNHPTKQLHLTSPNIKTKNFAMASTTFISTQPIILFGRGGYNGPENDEEEDSFSTSTPIDFGCGGYSCGPDDDDEEDGRGGYN